MELTMYLQCVIVISMAILNSCQGHRFYPGGKDGWVVNPSESYSHWAERNRFQINDTLYESHVFGYTKGVDSVLIVSKDDYKKCNTTSPIQSLQNGNDEFKFDRSGPFYFISGNYSSCQKGQKLIVVVLAVRHNNPDSAPPPVSPSPSNDSALAPKSSSASSMLIEPMVFVWGLSFVVSATFGLLI